MRQEVRKNAEEELRNFFSPRVLQASVYLKNVQYCRLDLLTRSLVILCTGMSFVLPNLISTSANAIASIVSGVPGWGGPRNYSTFKRGRNSFGTISSRLPLSVYIHGRPWNARAWALCFVGVNRNGNNTRCIARYRTIGLSAGTNIARYKNTENAAESVATRANR